MTNGRHRDSSESRFRWLKRPWCWLTSHEWVIFEYDPVDAVTVREATCNRCGEKRESVNAVSIGKEFPEGELYD